MFMNLNTLILSRKEIEPLLTMKDTIESVEQAFSAYGEGKVQMLPKMHIHFDKYNGFLAIMPAYIETLNAAAVKVGTGHPDNPQKHGLPLVMATIILNDPETGFPLAIMDGTWITAMRTGATGAVAAKYLARKNSRNIAIIGAGVQATTQLKGLNEIFDIEAVKVYDIDASRSEKYAKQMSKELKLQIKIAKNVETAVEGADIVTTVTPSRVPYLKNEWIKPGTHINAFGADAEGKEELDPTILKRAKIVVDNKKQSLRIGELNLPYSKGLIKEEDIYADIGEIVSGKKEGRVLNNEITVFDSSGLPIQDAAVAWKTYQLAKAKKIGKPLRIV
jgi:alanine dehydrogenase